MRTAQPDDDRHHLQRAMNRHKLLERQLRRHLPDGSVAAGLDKLIEAINQAYCDADADHAFIERSLELMSTELTERNTQLRTELAERQAVEQTLRQERAEQQALIVKLEEAQNQLLQSEKMASIGQLAAGVAHEINNPIGFVGSNMGTLREYFSDLLGILAEYESVEQDLPESARKRVKEIKRQLNLEYLREDAVILLDESTDGIRRVTQIVQDLKDFSHVDETQWQWSNLHKGLDSTLNIVHSEIKYVAKVIKEYGDIPEVECLASQINQVFMNLLVNAAHAMHERRGHITIRTGMQGIDSVFVEISDQGCGIPEDNLRRIFDPFFTTKPIGKGTGLGLSLSYSIVKKHAGQIEVSSKVDVGTTFRISLPCKRAAIDH